MDRREIIYYLEHVKLFRFAQYSQCRIGSAEFSKHLRYASAIDHVIQYVTKKLANNDPILQKLSTVDRDLVLEGNNEIFAMTYRCSLDKPANIDKWFAEWADLVIATAPDDQD